MFSNISLLTKWLQVKVMVILFLQWMRLLPSCKWYRCELELADIQADIFMELLGIEKRPQPTAADIEMISQAVQAAREVLVSLKGVKEGSNGWAR